jgi:hypothetical protein
MNKRLATTIVGIFFLTLLSFGQAAAAQFTVSVKNLTNGIWFTPLLIAAHNGATSLFETGESASAALQAMAEGGDISGLSAQVGGADADTKENPAGGLLPPGASTGNVMLDTDATGNAFLSIVAMLLPTNDGFVGLDSLPIPVVPGIYKYYLLAYDAGTEANDERIVGPAGGAPGVPGIPAAPGGDGGKKGKGVTDFETNTMVHIHRGIIGDDKRKGKKSDLDRSIHRFKNPVAEVTLEVQ